MKHFEDFIEDQFDFHSYCLRKVTLRAYINLLRFEDEVYGQKFFCEAAAGIIRIYLRLHDKPLNDETEEPDYSTMNAMEKKKAKAIARKKKKAEEKKEADMQLKREQNGSQKGGKLSFVDEDPFGKELLKKNALDEAKSFSFLLTTHSPNHIESWILHYDVCKRRSKTLMALQALFKAKSIDPDNVELFHRIVDFARSMSSLELPEKIKTVVSSEAPSLWNNECLSDYLLHAAKNIKRDPFSDLPMRAGVAKAMFENKVCSVAEASSLITSGGMGSRKVTSDSCSYALSVLESFGKEAAESTALWSEQMKDRFSIIS